MLYSGQQYDTLSPDQLNECFNLIESCMVASGSRGFQIVLSPSGHGDCRSVVHIRHPQYAGHIEFPSVDRDTFRVTLVATRGCYDSRTVFVPNSETAYSVIGLYLSNFIGATK